MLPRTTAESGEKTRPKTNLVHSKVVRKSLVAIILNILSIYHVLIIQYRSKFSIS